MRLFARLKSWWQRIRRGRPLEAFTLYSEVQDRYAGIHSNFGPALAIFSTRERAIVFAGAEDLPTFLPARVHADLSPDDVRAWWSQGFSCAAVNLASGGKPADVLPIKWLCDDPAPPNLQHFLTLVGAAAWRQDRALQKEREKKFRRTSRGEREILMAMHAGEHAQFAEARRLLHKAWHRRPELQGVATLALAELALKQRRVREAREHFQAVVGIALQAGQPGSVLTTSVDPDHRDLVAHALHGLARLHPRRDNQRGWSERLALLRQAHALAPESLPVMLELARTLLEPETRQRTTPPVLDAISLDSLSVQVPPLEGLSPEEESAVREGEAMLLRLAGAHPHAEPVLQERAKLLLNRGNFAEALPISRRIVNLAPNRLGWLLRHADLCDATDHTEEGYRTLTKALVQSPILDIVTRFHLFCARQGVRGLHRDEPADAEAVVRCFETLTRAHPQMGWAHMGLALSLAQLPPGHPLRNPQVETQAREKALSLGVPASASQYDLQLEDLLSQMMPGELHMGSTPAGFAGEDEEHWLDSDELTVEPLVEDLSPPGDWDAWFQDALDQGLIADGSEDVEADEWDIDPDSPTN